MTDKNLLKDYSNDPDRIQEDETESAGNTTLAGRKKLLFIGLAIGLILVVSAVLVMVFIFPDSQTDPGNRPVVQKPIEPVAPSSAVTTEDFFDDIFNLSPFERIPLKDNANMSLISLNISMELADPGYRQQVSAMESAFRKIVEEQARQYTWLELRSPEGKIKFKYELLEKLNSQSDRVMIRNIFFTYFLMQ